MNLGFSLAQDNVKMPPVAVNVVLAVNRSLCRDFHPRIFACATYLRIAVSVTLPPPATPCYAGTRLYNSSHDSGYRMLLGQKRAKIEDSQQQRLQAINHSRTSPMYKTRPTARLGEPVREFVV